MTTRTKRSSTTVTVACKHPQGMTIPLINRSEPIKLHGTLSRHARFGAGMTDITADEWEAIQTQYGERPGQDRNGNPCTVPQAAWLKNGIVFAASTTKAVDSEAKEKSSLRTGFEPIDPKALDKTPGLAGAELQPYGGEDKNPRGL